jgi:CTP:molybdopterin cytidylyltransferase MocA
MPERTSVGAIILAAGHSSRMYTSKPLLAFDANTTFIQKIITTYLNWGCNKITIVTNKELSQHPVFLNFPEKCSVVVNEHPEFERFYSAKQGAIQLLDFSFCFLQNADNPFTTELTLSTLFKYRKSNITVIPSIQGKGGHPILLGNEAIRHIAEEKIDEGNLKEILKELPSKKIEIHDPSVLININNPEEYSKYFK